MNMWGEDDFILSHEGSWIYLRSNEYEHPVVTIMNHPLVGPAQFPHNAGSGCEVCGCMQHCTVGYDLEKIVTKQSLNMRGELRIFW